MLTNNELKCLCKSIFQDRSSPAGRKKLIRKKLIRKKLIKSMKALPYWVSCLASVRKLATFCFWTRNICSLKTNPIRKIAS